MMQTKFLLSALLAVVAFSKDAAAADTQQRRQLRRKSRPVQQKDQQDNNNNRQLQLDGDFELTNLFECFTTVLTTDPLASLAPTEFLTCATSLLQLGDAPLTDLLNCVGAAVGCDLTGENGNEDGNDDGDNNNNNGDDEGDDDEGDDEGGLLDFLTDTLGDLFEGGDLFGGGR